MKEIKLNCFSETIMIFGGGWIQLGVGSKESMRNDFPLDSDKSISTRGISDHFKG